MPIEPKQPRDLRYRDQLFKGAKELVFDTSDRGFIPLPIILRKLLRHLTPPELRLYVYLALRASRHGICYPTTDEMVHELGLTGTKNLSPHLKSLEGKHLIATNTMSGRKFYLVQNPRIALQWMANEGKLTKEEIIEINDLLADFRHPPLHEPVVVANAEPQPVRMFRLEEEE